MTEVDFNSDMGEGFGPWTIGDGVDAAIMPLISSANIATGFHAGDPSSMRRTVEMAAEHGVAIGPSGLPRPGRLRSPAHRRAGHRAGQRHALPAWRPARIRPAAGPAAATRQAPRRALHAPGARRGRRAPVRRDPATPGTGTAALLHARFGHLAHRSGTGPAAGARVLRACREGKVRTVEGEDLDIAFDSVCIHSDTPGALELVASTRARLEGAGIRIKAPR